MLSSFVSSFPDTSVSELHNFLPYNFLGNFGLPSPAYKLVFHTGDLGFRMMPDVYRATRYTEEEVRYYHTKGPYASVKGITGSKQLQALGFIFTQTFKKRLNLTVDFDRYSSLGFYKRQQSAANNIYISSNYSTKKERAGYYFYFLSSSQKHQENGGMNPDTLSLTTFTANKAVQNVRLSQASRDNRQYKAMLNPWIKLNAAPDSLNKINSYLQIRSSVSFSNIEYNDNAVATDNFYTLYYFDTLKTKDSARVMQLQNEARLAFSKPDRSFGFSAGYRHEYNSLWQYYDSVLINQSAVSDLVFQIPIASKDSAGNASVLLHNRLSLQYIFDGPAAENYKLQNNLNFFLHNPGFHFFLNLMAEKRNPDMIYNYWASNHFTWLGNGFSPVETQQFEGGISWKKRLSLTVTGQNISNYLFFNEAAQPGQLAVAIQNIGVNFTGSVTLLKHIGLYASHTIQSSTSNYVSLPEHVTQARVFFTAHPFKNNLQLNIGVQATRFQPFYAYSYMPSTQMFYLQDRRLSGDYPYLDFYLNARIRPVTFFLKIENILYGYSGPNYYVTPGYYQPDRAFRLGISWMFFD